MILSMLATLLKELVPSVTEKTWMSTRPMCGTLIVWIFVMRVLMIITSLVSYFINDAFVTAKYAHADEFDAEFFGISPREAVRVEPRAPGAATEATTAESGGTSLRQREPTGLERQRGVVAVRRQRAQDARVEESVGVEVSGVGRPERVETLTRDDRPRRARRVGAHEVTGRVEPRARRRHALDDAACRGNSVVGTDARVDDPERDVAGHRPERDPQVVGSLGGHRRCLVRCCLVHWARGVCRRAGDQDPPLVATGGFGAGAGLETVVFVDEPDDFDGLE